VYLKQLTDKEVDFVAQKGKKKVFSSCLSDF